MHKIYYLGVDKKILQYEEYPATNALYWMQLNLSLNSTNLNAQHNIIDFPHGIQFSLMHNFRYVRQDMNGITHDEIPHHIGVCVCVCVHHGFYYLVVAIR